MRNIAVWDQSFNHWSLSTKKIITMITCFIKEEIGIITRKVKPLDIISQGMKLPPVTVWVCLASTPLAVPQYHHHTNKNIRPYWIRGKIRYVIRFFRPICRRNCGQTRAPSNSSFHFDTRGELSRSSVISTINGIAGSTWAWLICFLLGSYSPAATFNIAKMFTVYTEWHIGAASEVIIRWGVTSDVF